MVTNCCDVGMTFGRSEDVGGIEGLVLRNGDKRVHLASVTKEFVRLEQKMLWMLACD